MSHFKYAAINKSNQLVKGDIGAISVRQATDRLAANGLVVLSVSREPGRLLQRMRSISTVGRLDKIQVTRFLYSFLSSGLSINKAIQITMEQTNNYRLKYILAEVGAKIREGQSLSRSLEPHIGVFGPYYVRLVRVGEDSGTLEDTLKHLLEQQEKEYELISNIRGAMIYPVIVILAAIAAVVFLMTFVIPTIAEVLIESGGELPIQTKALIAISGFFVNYGYFLLIAAILLPFALIQMNRTRPGKVFFEKIFFRIPIIKNIVIEYNVARVMRALWPPFRSGLSVNKALELTADTCGNRHYRESIEKSAQFVSRGIPLSEVLRGYSHLYPPSVYSMIEIGENTGKTDDMLKRLSEFYEQSVHNTFRNISSVVEPFLILFIGSTIGFIAVSVLTPIWKFSETI